MTNNLSTAKGYTLTAGQVARRAELLPSAENGAGYIRAVADNLARIRNAEDHEQVDYWLTRAEASLPGAPAITEIIRTIEPEDR
ncbi:hypothetical protein ACT17_14720 [Mycolicibacterium conceptionense]|uniref:Uncharacterized protein n=1 Tax=Mycolicibacterium conceptionense TaxID=451644 RepID=A0A0J8U963_9MYCO|nr:hypothetical protein [Mycolicibacterium conceptionense]KMV17547.1 hypothetical protein ACT17_14720 [Mycolicibacterium conceptionense]